MKVELLEPDCYDLWNEFVDLSPQGDVFCYSWWLDAATSSNFKIYVIKENNEIVAGMPLAYDDQNRINLPPFTRTLGILFRSREFKSEQKKASVERKWLMELIDNIPFDNFVQTCTHPNFTDWLPYRWKGFKQTTRYTYLMHFENRTIPDLWNSLDNLRRRTINRAKQNGIIIEECDDFSLVYKYAAMTYERQNLRFNIPFETLDRIDSSIKRNGNRLILTAGCKNKTHAVLYAAYNKKSAYYLISGSDPQLRRLGAHTYIMWAALSYFHEKVKYFNFGGSDVESIESHIKGFGGTLTPYFHIYNENQIWAQNNFHYYLKGMSYHLKGAFKIARNRFLRILN